MRKHIQCLNFEYHNKNIPPPLHLNNSEEYHFGIVKIQMKKNELIQNKHIHVVFSVDCSGSMTDICADNRTKIQHIKHTMENMIRVFSQKTNFTISVHINSFETEVHNIISNTVVDLSTMESIIHKIHTSMYPRDLTNIELALKTASQDIGSYKIENNANIVHILLTDGIPTIGSMDSTFLKTLVSPDYQNIFIGYGKQHDAHFMSELASNVKDLYLFIDVLEKAGLVYGEVIHNLLYKLIENTTISARDCEIYNYKTNTWDQTLYIGEMVSEMEKSFHVRSKTPTKSCIRINGNVIPDILEEIILLPTSVESNLTTYIFRQKTQELLFETKLFSSSSYQSRKHANLTFYKKHLFDDEERIIITQDPELEVNPESELKTKLYEHFQLMKAYMKQHNLENDKFLKMLCDDMIINYEMIGKKDFALYSCARQTSQGRQTSYTPSGNIVSKNHNISHDFEDSPYSTQGLVETMQTISAGPFDD